MRDTSSTITVSPRVGVLLTQITETPDLETALWKVLSDHIDLKTRILRQRIEAFESKWGMTFEEFSARGEAETLGQDSYAYEVESDFWEWEEAETLLRHYEALQFREVTGTIAFALIEKEQRIWGIDYDPSASLRTGNRRGWHLHPAGNPSEHVEIEPLSASDIAVHLQDVLLDMETVL
jgi:hypothetical protein